MSLIAAASGFVVFLLSVQVIQAHNDWGVTYTSTEICTVKGSTVEINCRYRYPSRIQRRYTRVEKTFWFTKLSGNKPVDVRTDSRNAGRVQHSCYEKSCTLRITDLRERDSAKYKFRFITNQPGGSYTGSPGVTLSVTAVQVQVTKVTVHQSYTEAELKCHSSCSPAAYFSYIWFKNGQKVMGKKTYTDNFYPGDNISCAFKGHEDYRSPSLYPSVLPSVSVSPSGEILEGSSVNLSCRIDADPSAKTAWYKENQTLSLGSSGIYRFTSINPEDRGIYHCRSEGKHSLSLFLDVQYGPQLPSVSVSPSGEIVEGNSVTLTCSSDANPAADYTWYKENEDSPKASGHNFTITDFRAEHSGNYYCEAQNTIGRHNSTSHLIVVAGSWKFPVAPSVTVISLIFIHLSVLLWIWRKRFSQQQSVSDESPDNRAQVQTTTCCSKLISQQVDELQYASVRFRSQTDALYSNMSPAQPHRNEEECVIYSAIKFSRAPGTRCEAAVVDPSALYSTVNKSH